MLITVTGGSGSGKSAYAEGVAEKLSSDGGILYYVAAMYPYGDDETTKRIENHRQRRRNKGYNTVECYTDIASMLERVSGDTLLIECMSNLLANEMFMEEGRLRYKEKDSEKKRKELAEKYIVLPVLELADKKNRVVVVTNEIFSDIDSSDEITGCYIRLLAYINRRLAFCSDDYVEVVCGIPLHCKDICDGRKV